MGSWDKRIPSPTSLPPQKLVGPANLDYTTQQQTRETLSQIRWWVKLTPMVVVWSPYMCHGSHVPIYTHTQNLFIYLFRLLWDRVSLCCFGACPGISSYRPGRPRTHRDLPDSASQVLGLKVCITTAQQRFTYLLFIQYSACMYACRQEESTRSHYRWLRATMWLLRIELRTFGRAGSALNL